jgi:N6-adenosine-specific RNA methylase IME4
VAAGGDDGVNESKRYGVIVADPPWDLSGWSVGRNKGPLKHYPVLDTPSICRLPVAQIIRPDAVLLLWTVWAKVPDALAVMEAWGFSYVAGFPWIKLTSEPRQMLDGEWEYRPSYGIGNWVRGCSEPLLIGRRGDIRAPYSPYLGLLSKRLEHSRKPEHIYDYAEPFPGPYLELFARRPRPGWDQYGNEVDGGISLAVPA